MNFQIDVSSTYSAPTAPPAPPSSSETADLLRQLLEVQREQLAIARASLIGQDARTRWRAYLAKWGDEFPDLAGDCRRVLPLLERRYGQLMGELAGHLEDEDALESDFALQELLDRYGTRLAQLGTMLHLVGPLAEAGAIDG
ncbi:MAG: hypothetical protein K2W96_09510 [Gemmataceae bacterium]|nr:hypothetical protein [Gemmataceae bacterium]